MNLLKERGAQKGEAKMYYIGLGFLIAIGVFFAIKNYQDRNNDITVHLPKVEVR